MEDETPEPKGREVTAWTNFAIERESTATRGEFRSVLATSGEASDGHILSIRGMTVPVTMPMLFRHNSTVEIPALGRIVDPVKSRDGDIEVLRVTGRFDLEGDPNDPLLAIRKGFASMVQQGTLDAMSIRWDPIFGKFVPRSTLGKDHPAHVPPGTEGPANWGMYFEESRAQEGSIVAIGADPQALMGRAHDAESMFEEAYWTVLAGRMGAGEAIPEVPLEQRELFAAMTKVVVDTVRETVQETFTLMRERSEEDDDGESRSVESIEDLSVDDETSREVPVETVEYDAPPQIRRLEGDSLKSLIRETASESVERRLGFALGKVVK